MSLEWDAEKVGFRCTIHYVGSGNENLRVSAHHERDLWYNLATWTPILGYHWHDGFVDGGNENSRMSAHHMHDPWYNFVIWLST